MMDGQTDGRTDGRTDAWGKTICLPTLKGGDINKVHKWTFCHIGRQGQYRGTVGKGAQKCPRYRENMPRSGNIMCMLDVTTHALAHEHGELLADWLRVAD